MAFSVHDHDAHNHRRRRGRPHRRARLAVPARAARRPGLRPDPIDPHGRRAARLEGELRRRALPRDHRHARHRFGDGTYRYFDTPLPDLIDAGRHALYPPLAELANRWAERLGAPDGYPADLDPFLERCHRAGQERPTPLILRYTAGGHNALHQDIYGEVAFPLQAVTLLSSLGDFAGGQFVLVEGRPRQQSRAHVIDLDPGAFLIFPTRQRPVRGTRGFYRAAMRHGVATVLAGERMTLGLIFHDAT